MSKQWGRRRSDNRAYAKGSVPVSGPITVTVPPTKETSSARQLLSMELSFHKKSQGKPKDFTMYPQEFFLQYGKIYNSKEQLTDEELSKLKLDAQMINPKLKECYYNSAMLATSNPEYTYVEGYITSRGLPTLPHGWVVDKKGRVIDVTLQVKSRGGDFEKLRRGKKVKSFDVSNNVIGVVPEGWEYYGVPIKTDYLMKSMLKRGLSPPLIDYTHGFDALKLTKSRIRKEVLA